MCLSRSREHGAARGGGQRVRAAAGGRERTGPGAPGAQRPYGQTPRLWVGLDVPVTVGKHISVVSGQKQKVTFLGGHETGSSPTGERRSFGCVVSALTCKSITVSCYLVESYRLR